MVPALATSCSSSSSSHTDPANEYYVSRNPTPKPPLSAAISLPAIPSDRDPPMIPSPTPVPASKESSFLIAPHPLSISRYHRQLLVPSLSVRGQEAMSKAKVLIVGLGGLGSPASLYLAAAGIGTLGLVDADTVERSNLHRQILHTERSVNEGMSKVESAMQRLRELNSEIRYVGYRDRFVAENAVGIVEGRVCGVVDWGKCTSGLTVDGGYDIVLDCTDNPATRYLISDVCVVLGRVCVSAAAQRGEGQLMRLNYPPRPHGSESILSQQLPAGVPAISTPPHDPTVEESHRGKNAIKEKGPCYRCVFRQPPSPDTVQSCSEIGILGPVVGVMGTLMAMEVINIISASTTHALARTKRNETAIARSGEGGENEEEKWRPNLLLYNAQSPDPKGMFRSVGLRGAPRRDCLACGDEELLKTMGKKKITSQGIERGEIDYPAFCGLVTTEGGDDVVGILDDRRRITAPDFLERMQRRHRKGRGDGEEDEEEDEKDEEDEDAHGMVVVDVREEVEYEMGAKLRNSINIPMSTIRSLKDWTAVEDLIDPETSEANHGEDGRGGRDICFVCQRGNDSQVVARIFMDAADSGRLRRSRSRSRSKSRSRSRNRSRWIGDVVGGFEALQRYL